MRRPTTAIFLALLLMQAGSSLTLQANDEPTESNAQASASHLEYKVNNRHAVAINWDLAVGRRAAQAATDVEDTNNQYSDDEMFKDAGADVDRSSDSDFNKAEVRIFPNPADDYVTIQAGDFAARVIVMDTRGNRLADMQIRSGDLDVSSLTPGVYLLRIFDRYDNMVANELVVIQ